MSFESASFVDNSIFIVLTYVRYRYTSAKNLCRTIVLLCATVLCCPDARAQISADSVNGIVGKEVSLPFIYSGGVPLESEREFLVRGDFKLSNPTVFFPEVFRSALKTELLESNLESSTDSTWSFSLKLRATERVESQDQLFTLAGEALAGSDSLVRLLFHDFLFDEAPVPDLTGTIRTETIGSRFPYVRFAKLDPGRPNPTAPGITVTWGFRIDQESDVTFKIYDMIGQEVEVQDLGRLEQGVYVNTFTPDFFFPSGMFIVRLITNTGEALEVMHVLR